MTHLHRRFTDDQVKVLLNGYCQGVLTRAKIQDMLGIGKTRFFAILKEYRLVYHSFCKMEFRRVGRSGVSFQGHSFQRKERHHDLPRVL